MAFIQNFEQLANYLPTDEDIKRCEKEGNLIYIDDEYYNQHPLYAFVYAEHGMFMRYYRIRFFLYKTKNFYALILTDEKRDFNWITEFKILPGGIRTGINHNFYKRIINNQKGLGLFIMSETKLKKAVFFGTDDADDVDVDPGLIKQVNFKEHIVMDDVKPFINDMTIMLNNGIINYKKSVSKTKIVFKEGKAFRVPNTESLKVVPPPPPPPSITVYKAIDSQKKPSEGFSNRSVAMIPQEESEAVTKALKCKLIDVVTTEIVYV